MRENNKRLSPIRKYSVKFCRICGSKHLYNFLSLGSMPIPNGFLRKDELKDKEYHYPLGACVCEKCWLVQLTHVVPPQIMFKNYLYIPSTSKTMLEHFKSLASEVIEKYSLKNKDLVVDIGSNDGTLLGYFKEQEIKVLGIDPATNLAQVARMKGIETIDDFFTSKLADKVIEEKGRAKIITATNVVAHIHNVHELIEGVEKLLTNDGVFIMEFPYLVDLISKNEFDTIYHEHLSYFSVLPLVELFKRHNMEIVDLKRTPVHGGSIIVYVAKKESKYKKSNIVKEYIAQEKLKKLNQKSTYEDFARRVKVIKRDLKNYLNDLKKQGKTIVGYGASAKGNVLLNYCGINTKVLNCVVDSIPYKQGKYTPGTHIPIHPEIWLEKNIPDYVLLLSWNFADEILAKQIKYREKGGQFIITIPYLRIE